MVELHGHGGRGPLLFTGSPHRMQTLCWFLPSIQSDTMATDPYFFIEFSPVQSPVQSRVQVL